MVDSTPDSRAFPDRAATLTKLGQAVQELRQMKRYTGAGAMKEVASLQQQLDLALHANAGLAAEVEQVQLEANQQAHDADARLTETTSRFKAKLRLVQISKATTHCRLRTKAQEVSDLRAHMALAEDYNTVLSKRAQDYQHQNEWLRQQCDEYRGCVGALWHQFQTQGEDKDRQIKLMQDELDALKHLTCYKDGEFSTEISVEFYDCLQRGLSPKQSRALVIAQLSRRNIKCDRIPSLSVIKNMPQSMLFACRILVTKKYFKAISAFRNKFADGSWQKHRGNGVELSDGG
jgi:hypothetical protein